MVIWVTGLSASGKTTLAMELYRILKVGQQWVFLDGDTIRTILGEDLGHTLEDRMKNGYRISRLCKILELQGIHVIAAVLLCKDELRTYNRSYFDNYKEIHIDVNLEKLIERDNKQLYQGALNGTITDVVGIDIECEKSAKIDYIFDNTKDHEDFTEVAIDILQTLELEHKLEYHYSKINLLKYPEKYEYSQYRGSMFLDVFELSRQESLSYASTMHHVVDEEIVSNITKWLSDDEGYTKQVLCNLIQSATKDTVDPITFRMVKKFEVSKKLFVSYDKETWLKTSEQYDDIQNYLLFAILMIQVNHVSKSNQEKMICFNALLKVNDLLVSCKEEFNTENHWLLFNYVLKEELELYTAYKRELGNEI
ncbi:MAG: adenylyl-sulfate kinase [Eubacteriales bacterium]